MIRQIIFHPAARADLAEIWSWTVQRWGEAQAESYLTRLDVALAQLALAPGLIRERSEITPPVRIYPFRLHLVIYRTPDQALLVHRLVHARSNWQALFAD